MGNEAVAADLLDLGRVHLEDVILGLQAGVVGKQDDALGAGVELVGGLLDEGSLLVHLGEGMVAEAVGLDEVGTNELKRAVEVRDERLGEGLVGRVAELNGLLAVRVLLEGGDAVVDDGIVEEMLTSREEVSMDVGNSNS